VLLASWELVIEAVKARFVPLSVNENAGELPP
jgi:hypothetical protein